MSKIPRECIERAARIYASNQFASDALGVHVATFGRLCKRYGIETPYERRRSRHRSMHREERISEVYET